MYTINNMFTTTEWTDSGPKHTYTFEFDFKNKEEYLEQTAGWKSEYAELSKRIRLLKTYRKPENNPDKNDLYGSRNQYTLNNLQTEARQMCQMRVQAKVQAGNQMVEQRMAA